MLLGAVMLGCKKHQELRAPSQYTINCADWGKWVYFSFEQGKEVAVDNPKNDLSWDIGFHRYDFKTNGGLSGKGQGAACKTTATQIEQLTKLPAPLQWVVDEQASCLMNFDFSSMGTSSSASQYDDTQTRNPALSGRSKVEEFTVGKLKGRLARFYENGIVIQTFGMPPEYDLAPYVYLVRTAKGRVVRFKVTHIMDEKGNRGIVSFNYAFLE